MKKSKNALLSVIVPVYNGKDYLEICINSILSQTYKNLECILVDDGSTDGSAELCDTYAETDERIKVLHKFRRGVSSARNLGLSVAKGQYIAFVDSDDCIDFDMYEILINILQHYHCDIAACNYITDTVCIPKTNPVIPTPVYIENNVEIYKSTTRNKNSIEGYIWNKVVKKEIIGEIRFREDITICEDSVFSWDIFSNAQSACYVDLKMYHYRINVNSATRSSSIEKHLSAIKAYEYMIAKAIAIDDQCVSDLYIQYLNRNRAIMQRIFLNWKDNKKYYSGIKNNILTNCPKYVQTPTQNILDFSLKFGSFSARIVYGIREYLLQYKKM